MICGMDVQILRCFVAHDISEYYRERIANKAISFREILVNKRPPVKRVAPCT